MSQHLSNLKYVICNLIKIEHQILGGLGHCKEEGSIFKPIVDFRCEKNFLMFLHTVAITIHSIFEKNVFTFPPM